MSFPNAPPPGNKHGMFIQYLMTDAFQMGANESREQARRDQLLRQVPGIEPGTCDANQSLEVLEGYISFLLKHIEYLTNMGVPVSADGKILFLWDAYPKMMHRYIPSPELNRQVGGIGCWWP